MRVCVIAPLYHPALGGLGRQAMLLSERLSEEGVAVFVIARRMKDMPPAVYSKTIKVHRAWSIKPHIFTYERVELRNILISLSFCISCTTLLILRRKDYDLVHFHGATLPLFFTLPFLKCMGKKVIAKVAAAKIGTEAGSLKGRYYGLGNFLIRFLHFMDGFIATSGEINDGLLLDGFSSKKIYRIPNFIDLKQLSGPKDKNKALLKKNLGLEDKPMVLFTGRFISRKGINYLLEAWKQVVNRFSHVSLVLLGDGPLLADMKEMSLELNIEDSVKFCGQVSNVEKYLYAADIYALPSLQEGMPNALLEAMSCGLPSVATRIGGVVDIIKDGKNGILVDPGNTDEIACALVKLLENKKSANSLGFEALQTIQEDYSLDKIVKRYVELYNTITLLK